MKKNPLIHPNTILGKNVRLGYGIITEKDCEIGDNTFIGNYVILRPETKIGNNCSIGHHTVIEGKTTIGNRVSIHTLCHITSYMVIEDDVFIGPCTLLTNTKRIKHGRNFPLIETGSMIKRAARIGGGVTVLPDIVIGENALIGAGSVVTKNIPPREIWFGNPAIKHGIIPKEEVL
ncbi:hypothetical protein LCGC14_1178100 [marine sediment metagenome]|uniref:N-acetyltransferase n=1 Tax=marine sediment metagenome TaxID=412755 RepID=A0A0F9MAQ9_9ZZZZ